MSTHTTTVNRDLRRARCRDNWHAGFGRRAGETHRWKHRQGAPVRPHLVRSPRHLHRVLTAYLEHYNTARPHRGNHLDVPVPPAQPAAQRAPLDRIERVDILGGLIHEYRAA